MHQGKKARIKGNIRECTYFLRKIDRISNKIDTYNMMKIFPSNKIQTLKYLNEMQDIKDNVNRGTKRDCFIINSLNSELALTN